MSKLSTMIFIMAFGTITGIIVVALLTMGMSEPYHFFGAAGAGLVIAAIVSVLIAKQIEGA